MSAPPASRLPRHREIAAELAARIERGQYGPGERLPGEWAIAREQAVARETVRRALALLATQGLVERRHGVGSIVCPRRIERSPQNLASLTDELLARGLRPGARVSAVVRGRPSAEVCASLRVGPRSEIVSVSRVRLADGVVIGRQVTCIPARFVPGIEHHIRDDVSLAAVLGERYQLRAVEAELAITSVAADAESAAALGCEPGSPLLKTMRVGFDADARPFERTDGWYLPERYEYRQWQLEPPPPPQKSS